MTCGWFGACEWHRRSTRKHDKENITNQDEKSEVDEAKIGKENDELIGNFEIIWQSEMKRKKTRLEEENRGKTIKTTQVDGGNKRCKIDALLLNETNTKWKETNKGIMERMINKIGREVSIKTADRKEWRMT